MPSDHQAEDKKGTSKKKSKGSYALGLVSQAGVAAKKAWAEGTIVRTPKELFTQYNPLDKTEVYCYSALPTPTSIRLLEVSGGNPGDLIQCKLHTIDLRHSPKYIALSYSWEKDGSWTKWVASIAGELVGNAFRHIGFNLPKSKDTDTDSTDTRVMMCDGKKMMIKPNLYDALLQIRQVTPGYYWIDAVCMNQSDNTEKTQQIQMMSEIYRAAESVTVWLGKCPQLLSSGVARLEAAQGNLGPMGGEDVRSGKKRMLGDDSERHAFIGAAYLLSRRWFGRLWVLQEFCLAKRIDIRFGEHRIRPETVVGLIQSFKNILEGKEGDDKGKSGYGFANFFRPFWGLHIKFVTPLLESRDFFQQGMQWSLEEWLRLTKGRSASDNRDFVNAGLALVRPASLTIDQSMQLEDTSQSGPRLWSSLHATAGVDRFEVMLNLAACLLTQSQSVFVLSIGSLGIDSHLPTWMPDPGSQVDGVLEPFAFLKGTNFGACSGLDALARTLIADSPIDGDPVLGLIEYLSIQVPKFLGQLKKMSEPKPKSRGVEGYVSRKMDSRKEKPSVEEATALAVRLEEAWTKLKSMYPDKPWPSLEATPKQEPSSDHQTFVSLAIKVYGWRALFLTHEGLLGLGMCWVEEGEVVMLVESGYVPYVFGSAEEQAKKNVKEVEEKLEKLGKEPQPLSQKQKETQLELKKHLNFLQNGMGKQGGAWALHGEAYVHGIMHGEALDESRVFETIAIN
ncbi:heterokaryon incompatibility protein-domain-containing protein [Xylaria scruposa]|nr:heterokaryon incompatibility protein-domain-containing protein [Xylaria scruposa]